MAVSEYIDIFDFTPGMFADFHAGLSGVESGASSLPRDGAATVENTWACVAEPGGALRPLPARTQGETEANVPLPLGTGYSAYYPTSQESSFIVDAVVQGPVRTYTGGVNNEWHNPLIEQDFVTVYHAYNFANLSGGVYYVHQFLQARTYKLPYSATVDIYFNRSNTYSTGSEASKRIIPAGTLEIGRTDDEADPYPPTADDQLRTLLVGSAFTPYYDFNMENATAISWEATFSSFETSTEPHALGAPGNFPRKGGLWVSPDPDNMPAFAGYDSQRTKTPTWSYEHYPRMLIMHQGRVVLLTSVNGEVAQLAGGSNYVADSDLVYFTSPYNFFATKDENVKTFVEEAPFGWGTGASLGANSLLLIKKSGGAVLISGSLNSPTVRRLPMVQSTGEAMHVPVVCPLGLVYGSEAGVFAWNNGDTSQHLSPQLDGFFWRHERQVGGAYTDYYAGSRGRFGWWHPWVLVPNDFLYDTRTRSWWRLEDIDAGELSTCPHNVFRVSPSNANKLYAFRYRLNSTNDVVWDTYEYESLASDWSWQSQPLLRTRTRLTNFHEIHLYAQPGQASVGTVITVTLTGVDDYGQPLDSVDTEFDLANSGTDFPSVLVMNIEPNFTARFVQIKFTCTTDSGPGPKILGVRLGVSDGQQPGAI